MKKSIKYLLWSALFIFLSPIWLLSLFLIKNSVFPSLQAGTLSDWITTASTLVTTIIAIMAFRAAPNWIAKHKDQDAFNLSKELILFDHEKILNSLEGIYANFDFVLDIDDFNATDILHIVPPKDIEKLELKLIESRKNYSNIKRKEIVLSKLGWKLKHRQSHLHRSIKNDFELQSHECFMILQYIKAIQHDMSSSLIPQRCEMVVTKIKLIVDRKKKMVSEISEFDNYCESILDNFEISSL
ncbi:hypothetical protein GKQ23_13110 [Erwinia sp. E602]|uniref:hypothetical protein n=1 Tax=Erwinia sp. E602 TaxID=2675378 RepID=UPI001BAB7DCC|nr:hypothetical protein [Erwinia sp. E602]QUG75873.1 hypothetical protein GKQ23_13110 [Erwinia sp. E602]